MREDRRTPQASHEAVVAGLARTTSGRPAASDTRGATPRFLQGVFPFAGRGLFDPIPVDDSLVYTVPVGASAEILYFRAGNWSDDLIYFTLCADSRPIRYFAVAPKGDCHVLLAIVDEHPAGTRLTVHIAAPRNINGTVLVDIGLLETPWEVAA